MILANGDSWTGGRTVPADYWPLRLEQTLNRPVKNLARQGSSNQRILRTTLHHLFTEQEPIEQVIVGWTSCDRAELPRSQGGHYSITPLKAWAPELERAAIAQQLHTVYYQHCHNLQLSLVSFLQGLLILQEICRSRGIALLNFQSFRNNFQSIEPGWPELTALQQQLIQSQWIASTMAESLSQYDLLPSQHPVEEGNKRWAEIIAEHLANKPVD
jgi:hypothetical protein